MIVLKRGPELREDLERPYFEIGQRIKEWRVSAGLKQTDVASNDGAGVKYATLQLVESGRRAPSVELLKFLHDVYGVDLNILLCGE